MMQLFSRPAFIFEENVAKKRLKDVQVYVSNLGFEPRNFQPFIHAPDVYIMLLPL